MSFVTKDKSDKHEHKFIKFGVKKIIKVQQNYTGTSGDRAFIVRRCECGKIMPLDYGLTSNMRNKLKELIT